MEHKIFNTPIVSVSMLTYNHELYVEDAINSVLSQDFPLPYEVVIGDDCSSDRTVEVVNTLKITLPVNIRFETNKENLGIPENLIKTIGRCRGKYICFLSGDDYFIDSHKLTRQYEFLESNPEYLAVGTVIQAKNSTDGKPLGNAPSEEFTKREFTLKDFLNGNNYPLAGLMFRNIMLTEEGKKEVHIVSDASRYIDDLTFCIVLLKMGRVYIMSDVTYGYRVVRGGGGSNFNSINTAMSSYRKHIELLNNLFSYYKAQMDLFVRYEIHVDLAFWNAVKTFSYFDFFQVYRTIPRTYRRFFGRNLFSQAVKFCIKHIWSVIRHKTPKKGGQNEN